jgi:hypothetical protein
MYSLTKVLPKVTHIKHKDKNSTLADYMTRAKSDSCQYHKRCKEHDPTKILATTCANTSQGNRTSIQY